MLTKEGAAPQSRAWLDRIGCRGEDPEIFFPLSPKDTRTIAEAQAVCRPCPVRSECLEDMVQAYRPGWEGIRAGLFFPYEHPNPKYRKTHPA